MFEDYLNVEMVRNCVEMCLLQFFYHVWVKLLHVGSVYPKFEVRGDLGKKLRCVAISKSCQMHLWSNVRGGLGDLWWEALAPSTTIRNPKYWTREWKTGWNEVRRCGVSQWVWNANGAPDDGATHTHTHTQPLYGSVEFVRENPGEPVPKETFTHYSHRSHQSSLSAFSI